MARRESIVENARRHSIVSSGAVNLIYLRGGRAGPTRARRVACPCARAWRPSPLGASRRALSRRPPGAARPRPPPAARRRREGSETPPRGRVRDGRVLRPRRRLAANSPRSSARPPRSGRSRRRARGARVGDEVERRELVRLVIAVTSAPRRLERRAREVASRVRVRNPPPPPPPPSPPRARRRARPPPPRRARSPPPSAPPQQIPPQVPRLLRRRVRPGGAGAHTGRQGERSSGVPECTTAIVV